MSCSPLFFKSMSVLGEYPEAHKSKTDSWVIAVIVGIFVKTRVDNPVLSRMITPMLGSHSMKCVNCVTV